MHKFYSNLFIFATFRREVKLRSSSNLKQRFAALLKKFKVNEEEVLGGVDQVNIDRASLRFIKKVHKGHALSRFHSGFA